MNSYQIFLDDNRASLLRQVPEGGNPIAFTGKKAGIMWRALTAAERAPYEQRAAKFLGDYEASLEEFKAKGGTLKITKRFSVRRVIEGPGGKRRRVPRDKDRPVKPCAGGYGVFLKEMRASIKASMPSGLNEADLLRAVAAQFRGLPEDVKIDYNKRYHNLLEEYREKMKAYESRVRKATADLRLSVQRADGTPTTLALLLGQTAASGYLWRITSLPRHASSRCATPLLALRDWLSKHGTKMTISSREELEAWRPRDGDAGFEPATSVDAKSRTQNPRTQQPTVKKVDRKKKIAEDARRRIQRPPVRVTKRANVSPSIKNPPSKQANANPSIQDPPSQQAQNTLSEAAVVDALPGLESWSYRISVLLTCLPASTATSNDADETGLQKRETNVLVLGGHDLPDCLGDVQNLKILQMKQVAPTGSYGRCRAEEPNLEQK
eukprot:CAMPEP_0172757382 /NCGR_PEP_ID=MMETSP1074-20121228/163651_1 /TAXON_ID=2916 /ORGANISM="Ceratium fusus, Strain PA161109" /LENGTH=436 /DNA_ID=CAMNT_0013590797 /DNA_START=11 /DNA_END=1322 /DNA_ORIENTATION=-